LFCRTTGLPPTAWREAERARLRQGAADTRRLPGCFARMYTGAPVTPAA
jgi:hypothetical protein